MTELRISGDTPKSLAFHGRSPRAGKNSLAFASCATLLFDPKRVRAARDGVAIVPVRF